MTVPPTVLWQITDGEAMRRSTTRDRGKSSWQRIEVDLDRFAKPSAKGAVTLATAIMTVE